jgi:hypothetical protein
MNQRGSGRSSTSSASPRNTNANRGPQQINQTVAGMRSAGPQNWATQQSYYNDPGRQQATEFWRSSTTPAQRGDYEGFMSSYMANPGSLPGSPAAPGGPGGGGRGGRGGGGGGGGGAAGLTQAMLDQMLSVLGARGPALALQQTTLPAFQGQALQPFNPAQYNLAQKQLEQARAADAAAITQGGTQTTQALQGNYSNAYANTPVAQGPQTAPVGVGLQQTAGGGGNQQAATDVNQAAAGDQASFQNLLNVLAAADQSSQNSRLNEVALNTNTAQQGLGAQVRGLGAGINQARTRAYDQWQQQANERNYQNSLMRQQWQREALMRNQDIANQQRQGNWQQSNELISTRLQPLLEMIGSSAGSNVNLAGIQNLLRQWGQGAR